ncbi:hypothetical protein [Actinocorallia sp. A-T 12471]|uniref:hypothetical protein n=1 Tax=Actinocorallia sp. A-T 12471 TaxID=3089813 RepID=UPI0029CDC904|nr:hypothetical protein [Actinocorallia sp. A-T 12471]MDX6744869.1 hypothetical protein [Actinocorallia sp. A-T 12471]
MNQVVRCALAALIFLAGPGLAGYARVLQARAFAQESFGGDPYVRDALPLLPELWPLAILLVVLPWVGYRRRDALLYVIPLYGWALFAKAAWRLTALRTPDWPPRDDTVTAAPRSA